VEDPGGEFASLLGLGEGAGPFAERGEGGAKPALGGALLPAEKNDEEGSADEDEIALELTCAEVAVQRSVEGEVEVDDGDEDGNYRWSEAGEGSQGADDGEAEGEGDAVEGGCPDGNQSGKDGEYDGAGVGDDAPGSRYGFVSFKSQGQFPVA
jgi:hypothetical protein